MNALDPGLFVYRSNRLEVLVELLAWLMRQPGQQPDDPMIPSRIAVANVGMARWLEHRLAERWGVLAQVELVFPAKAFDQVVHEAMQDQAELFAQDPWSSEVLTWAIVDAFEGILSGTEPEYEPLRAYLQEDLPKGREATVRALGLARQVADVFDRYVTYRPDLALAWTAGRGPEDLPQSQRWQPLLWRTLTARQGPDHAAARAQKMHALLDAAPASAFAQPLRIFGLSSLPPAMLELAGRLADRMPVELYLLCPSNVYWADLHRRRDRLQALGGPSEPLPSEEALREAGAEAGNPLLAAFGRVMRDFQISLEGLGDDVLVDRRDLFVDMARAQSWPEAEDPAFEDPTRAHTSALAHLQSDVLHARLSPAGPLDPLDDSVQFHACHGQIRQVEVLRDVLLGLFERDPQLEPREVVVMCPDIETFAPLITAVFEGGRRTPRNPEQDPPDWRPTGAPQIPFTVSDLSLRRTNPVAEALLRLLELPELRLSASLLMDLLALGPLRMRFGIEPQDLATIRTWVVDSGMRWGADAIDRAQAGQPAELGNTLQFGLDRLLLGVCVTDEPGHELGGIRPFDRIPPSQTTVLGRLVDFVTGLVELHGQLGEARTIAEWVAFVGGTPETRGLLERFTATEESERWLTWRVDEVLASLLEAAEAAQQSRPVAAAALRAALMGQMDLPNEHGPHERGGVTFSSLVPMRGLPHRVVCLLGMDEGAFPREGSQRAFDLMGQRPRRGDKNASADDRGALLEAIMAARSHLIILYAGRDVRTNETRAPAVPIVELQDVVDASFVAEDGVSASRRLTREHALQPFSPRNFVPPGAGLSFDPRLAAAANTLSVPSRDARAFFSPADPLPEAAAPTDAEPLALETLWQFLRAPHRSVLRQRFGLVEFDDAVVTVPEREPFDIEGGLEMWKVRHELLGASAAGASMAQVQARLQAEGRLPLGAAAEVAMAGPRTLAAVLSQAMAALPAPNGQVSLRTWMAGRTVVEHIGALREVSEVVCEFKVDDTTRAWRWVLAPWVRLLGRQVAEPDPDAQVVVIHPDDANAPKGVRWRTFSIAPDLAVASLERLVALYERGQTEPVPLLPNGSFLLAWQLKALKVGAEALDSTEAMTEALSGVPQEVLQKAAGAVQKAWRPYAGRGDANDPGVARLYGDRSPAFDGRGRLDPEFVRVALSVWGPIVAGRTACRKPPSVGRGSR